MSSDEPDGRPTRPAPAAPPAVAESPPPRRPSHLGSAPPPLRPPEADRTIPLGPHSAPAETPPPATRRPPTPEPPPAPAPPTPTDAPAPAPADEATDPDLASDDEIAQHLEEGLRTPSPVMYGLQAPPGPDADPDDPATRRGFFHGWRRGPPSVMPGETGVRLSRHLSYEIIVTIVTFLVASVLLFTSFQGEMRDVYIKGRQAMGLYPAAVSGEVVLVSVGPEGLYLWDPAHDDPEVTPRALLGELVTVLDEAGANVIVLDFLLDGPHEGDARLAEAAAAHGAVLAAERYVITDPAAGTAFSAGPAATLGASIATGYANLGEEALWTTADERLVRSTRLVQSLDRARLSAPWPTSVGQDQAEAEITPHLGLLAAWTHQRRKAGESTDAGELLATLGGACGPGGCDVGLAELGLAGGPALTSQLPINFRGPEGGDAIPTVRAAELLRIAGEPALYRSLGVDQPLVVPSWLRDRVEGKIVVVGRVDSAANDRFATPFSFPIPVGADMDGCRVQAQLIDTLLSGRHVRTAPTWLMVLLAGALLAALVVTAGRLREDVHTVAWLGAGGLLVALGTVLFVVTDGLVLGLSIPLTTILLGIVAVRLRGWAVD